MNTETGFAGWVAHHPASTVVTGIPLIVAADLVTTVAGWVAFVVLVALFTTVDATHDRGPCVRCVAEVPADLAAAVERWRALLWYHHASSRWWYLLGTAVALAGVFVSQVWWLFVLLLFVSSMLMCRAQVRHRQAALWCPHCPRGGGGVGTAGAPDPLVRRSR